MRFQISLARKISIGFLITPIILVAIGVFTYRSTVAFSESADVVAQTYRLLSRLNSAMENLASAESEARGYILTRDDRQYSYYRHAVGEVQSDLKRLRELVMDPQVKPLIDELERRIHARLERMHLTVSAGEEAGIEAVMEIAGTGRDLMDQVRAVAAEIETVERRLLLRRNQLAQTRGEQTLLVIVLGSLFATGVATLGGALLSREVLRRERLEHRLAEVQEREQRRIGQDLHDGVCQQLTGIALLSRSVQQKLAARSAPEAPAVAEIARLVNDSIEQVRQVTRGLHPVPAEANGLAVALRELADRTASTTQLVCTFECPQPVPVPDPVAAQHLYHIAQEAVHNAVRHAAARAIEIRLEADADTIRLRIADDGRGFDPAGAAGGLGLSTMQYRARSIGATLEISPNAGGGTIVACTLPRISFN